MATSLTRDLADAILNVVRTDREATETGLRLNNFLIGERMRDQAAEKLGDALEAFFGDKP